MNNSFLASTPDLPALEGETLALWKAGDTFKRTLQATEACEPWVFYDGPPFANGLPHYGHLLTGYAKDTFPRFQTMKGRNVERVFGWDTHGLPAELEAMKRLGMTQTSEVKELSVEAFNNVAREAVLKYTEEWETYVTRQARWVDFEGGYKTLDLSYMESVVWAFKSLYEKGLMYESYKVLPYCWQDETPLSTHELSMDDDGYKTRTDLSATVSFVLNGSKAAELSLSGVKVLAWTTTPWTLPMNKALAVNPELNYVVAEKDGGRYLLEESLAESYGFTAAERVLLGEKLVGLSYEPLFSYAPAEDEKSFTVLPASWVEATSGTGVVHVAPAHGELDKKLCDEFEVALFLGVNERGRYNTLVKDFEELHVLEANETVLQELGGRGLVYSQEFYEHNYPHCWRCGNPLLYSAVSSWFVKTTALRERMLELNEQVNWVPAHMKKVFSNWLENTRDWAVTRNRFFGSPVPVWKSDDPSYPRVDVYGSLSELEADFGVELTDLHRPYVDELTRVNPDDPTGKSTMRRVTDVLDVWFDSAAMPFAQFHYPFESKESFEANHPADFVVEYQGQTRGWFYVLHVLSTALFDRPAFKNVVSHGVVLGDDGKKMSKKTQNYPDVNGVFDHYGSDAMRAYLLGSPLLRGGTMSVSDEGLEGTVKNFMLPLWNAYRYFSLQTKPSESLAASNHPLDRYLVMLTDSLVTTVDESLSAFDTQKAYGAVSEFTEKLTNLYVKWSRPRFKVGDPSAYATLELCLSRLAVVLAPLLPLTAEYFWNKLHPESESVHLQSWPTTLAEGDLKQLEDEFKRFESLVTAVLSTRKKSGVRLRQPLANLTLLGLSESLDGSFEELLKQEVNVKRLTYDTLEFESSVKLLPKNLGKRLGAATQQVFADHKRGNWELSNGELTVGETKLLPDEYEASMTPKERGVDGFEEFPGGALLLDLKLTETLLLEGELQDWLRVVQDSRKAAGLAVDDLVAATLSFKENEKLSRLVDNEHLLTTLKSSGRLSEVAFVVDEAQEAALVVSVRQ